MAKRGRKWNKEATKLPASNPAPRWGGLWASLFGWDTLFRWDVLGALVPSFFIAVGTAMLSIDWFPRHLIVAEIFLTLAALLVITKTVGHATTYRASKISQITFWILLCGTTLGVWGLTIYSVEGHRREYNFVYLAPGVWLDSRTWDFVVIRRGPDPIYHTEVLFVDTVKQKQVLAGRTSITRADVDSYQTILKYHELDAHGLGSAFATQFHWTPVDPDHEHYDITITWRNGTVAEDLQIERVSGRWFWAMAITDRTNGKIVVDCKDPGFPFGPAKLKSCFPEMTKRD